MSELSITTTQNVNINFNAASVGERILSVIIDFVILAAYYTFLQYVVYDFMRLEDLVSDLDRWSQMAIWGFLSLPALLYALLMETFFEGQSVGKKIMKIKVIKIDGYQAGFGDYLIRWIFRIIEVMPPLSIIGLLTIIISKKAQRLGDMAAGTAVITLKNSVTIDHTILRELSDNYVPTYPLVIKLTDNDVRIIKEAHDVAVKAADFEVINKLQDKIEKVTGIKSVSRSPLEFIDTILKDYNYYTQKM